MLGIFRLFLSLVIMFILGLGLLQAYRSFSGIDPLTINPKSLVKNIFTSDSIYKLVTSLLSVNPTLQISDAKKILGPSKDKVAVKTNTLFKFAVITDSHTDYQNLSKALQQAKLSGAKFVVGLGDFSDVGTLSELQETKSAFDLAGLPYYITAGDHDLWDSRDKKSPPEENFKKVFGSPYQSFAFENTRIILVYDSDNYFGLDLMQLNWLEQELETMKLQPYKQQFIFTSIPLYHPSSDHIIGKTNPKLKDQADHLISIFQKNGIEEVIAGDTHLFSRYTEPNTGMKMTTVGAVTSSRNPQAPRFAIVDIFDDGSYNIEDVEIK